jgi:hypothetical protein
VGELGTGRHEGVVTQPLRMLCGVRPDTWNTSRRGTPSPVSINGVSRHISGAAVDLPDELVEFVSSYGQPVVPTTVVGFGGRRCSVIGEALVECLQREPVAAGEPMTVCVEGRLDRGVAEAELDGVEVPTCIDQEPDMGVAEILETQCLVESFGVAARRF